MSITDTYKDQFRIFSFDEDISRGSLMTEMFRSQGYNYASFSDNETFLQTIEIQVPHIFILYYQPMSMKFREMLSKIREASSEVEVVLLGSNDFWPGIRSLMQNGLVNDFWSWPIASREVLRLRVDKIIEKTIFKYIGEQRDEETRKIVDALDDMKNQSQGLQQAGLIGMDFLNFNTEAKTEARLIESSIDSLKQTYPKGDFVYLKNYEARRQLLVMRTSFCKETYYNGQTIDVSTEQLEVDKGHDFETVGQLLQNTFECEDDFLIFPLQFAGKIYGFLMALYTDRSEEPAIKKMARYMSLSLRNLELEKVEPSVSTIMPTENLRVEERQLFKLLSREVSRARRIEMPVSVIVAHIEFSSDHDQERKEFFNTLNQNLRSYDFYTQISEDEVAIVLPHCTFEDAAVKAERLRRTLLNRGMKTQNTPVRLCFGVSEYPRLSADSDQMMIDSRAACDQVIASGKNKVCLYTAPKDFEAEFQV